MYESFTIRPIACIKKACMVVLEGCGNRIHGTEGWNKSKVSFSAHMVCLSLRYLSLKCN